jgi:Ca-activated chloride channel family protein
MRIGMAWYRAGEFERAVAAFGQLSSADGHFNRANALLLQGKYDAAVAAYEQAIAKRPDWQAAVDNRALALARKARLAPPEDDAGGTGGKLAADDFVLDSSGRTDGASGEQTTEGGTPLTDAQMRELWLRRVETRPADFLRARFARQLQRQSETGP